MAFPSTHVRRADEDSRTVPADQLYALLSVQRRRYALARLRDRDGPIPLVELAAAVAERESSVTADATVRKRRRVHVSLYHEHVPALADAGLVAFDSSDRRVELTARGEAVCSQLDADR